MIVYVVIGSIDYEDSYVLRVYEKEEDAEKFMKEQEETGSCDDYFIQKEELLK